MFFFFSSRRRHTRLTCDWSSDVCSSDLGLLFARRVTHALHLPAKSVRISASEKQASQGRSARGYLGNMARCEDAARDRKSVGEGKRGGHGGRRMDEKTKSTMTQCVNDL